MLILDEPTNHLDLDAREALEDALQAFEGALLLVSHDRALLDAVGTRTVAFEDGRLRSYEGGWAEYARVREERREAGRGARPKQERRAAASRAGNGRAARSGPSKNAVRRVGELEREVERAEASLAALEDELADPAMWSSPTRPRAGDGAPRAGEAGRRAGLRRLGARRPRSRAGQRATGAAAGRSPGRGRMAHQSSRDGSPRVMRYEKRLSGSALRDAVLTVSTRRSLQLKSFCVASTSP